MACVLPCHHRVGRGIGREGEVGAGQGSAWRPAAEGLAHRAAYACRMTPWPAMPGYGSFVRTNAEVPAVGQRPPLTKRLKPRHWAALDYVVGGVFGLILFTTVRPGVVQAIESPYGWVPYRPLALTWPLVLFLVLMAVVAVGMRRRRPAFMLGVLLAGSVIVTLLTGPKAGALTYFLPVAYVLYLVAATYERRQAAVRVLIAVFATLVADAVLI